MSVVHLAYYTHEKEDEDFRIPVGSQWIAITSDYDQRLIAALKLNFTGEVRRWNPWTKKWYVLRDLESRLFEVLKGIGYSALGPKPSKKKSTAEKPDDAKPSDAKPAGAKKAKAKASHVSGEADPFKAKPFSSSRFASEFFGVHARSAGSPSSTTRAPAAPPDDYTLLEILPTARFEVAKAAYRALSMLYHTDHGGDNGKMVALNAAWERLCRKYGRTI